MVKAIKWWGKQDIKYEKIDIINNEGEHMMKTKDGVSSLRMFCCNHKADSSIALHASKSRANVPIVLRDADILMFPIYNYSMCAISKECKVKYGKSSYANIDTICK